MNDQHGILIGSEVSILELLASADTTDEKQAAILMFVLKPHPQKLYYQLVLVFIFTEIQRIPI